MDVLAAVALGEQHGAPLRASPGELLRESLPIFLGEAGEQLHPREEFVHGSSLPDSPGAVMCVT